MYFQNCFLRTYIAWWVVVENIRQNYRSIRKTGPIFIDIIVGSWQILNATWTLNNKMLFFAKLIG